MSGFWRQVARAVGRRPQPWDVLQEQVARALFEVDYPHSDWDQVTRAVRAVYTDGADRAMQALLKCNVDLPAQRRPSS